MRLGMCVPLTITAIPSLVALSVVCLLQHDQLQRHTALQLFIPVLKYPFKQASWAALNLLGLVDVRESTFFPFCPSLVHEVDSSIEVAEKSSILTCRSMAFKGLVN